MMPLLDVLNMKLSAYTDRASTLPGLARYAAVACSKALRIERQRSNESVTGSLTFGPILAHSFLFYTLLITV